MAALKENFGYALVDARTDKVVRFINFSTIQNDVRNYIKSSSFYTRTYTEGATYLLFNSLFDDNFDLTMWLIDVLEKKGVDDPKLKTVLYTKTYYATERDKRGLKDLTNEYITSSNSKMHHYEIPILYEYDLKSDEKDEKHIVSRKDLLDPFMTNVRICFELACKAFKVQYFSKEEANNKGLAEEYKIYEVCKALEDVNSPTGVLKIYNIIVPYLLFNPEKIKGINFEDLKNNLKKYSLSVNEYNNHFSKEEIEEMKNLKKYLLNIRKFIDFSSLKEETANEYGEIFNKAFNSIDTMYRVIVRSNKGNENIKYDPSENKNYTKLEQITEIYKYFDSLKRKGEFTINDDVNYAYRLVFNIVDCNKLLMKHSLNNGTQRTK